MSVVSQFMHSASEDHMVAEIQILTYLKSAPCKGIFYGKHGHLKVDGFTNADWAGNVIDRRSISGYFTFVGGCKIYTPNIGYVIHRWYLSHIDYFLLCLLS